MYVLEEVVLAQEPDTRSLTRCAKKDGSLDAAVFYKLRTWGGILSPSHEFVWANRAPSKVRFFAWLLSKARIQSRSSLLKKKVLTAEEAHCPTCDAPEESPNHIIFECPMAARFWDVLGYRFPPCPDVRHLHGYGSPTAIPKGTASTFVLLCLWNLWKHRNAVAFREQAPSLPLLLRNCRDESLLWKARLPPGSEDDADAWLRCIDNAMRRSVS